MLEIQFLRYFGGSIIIWGGGSPIDISEKSQKFGLFMIIIFRSNPDFSFRGCYTYAPPGLTEDYSFCYLVMWLDRLFICC